MLFVSAFLFSANKSQTDLPAPALQYGHLMDATIVYLLWGARILDLNVTPLIHFRFLAARAASCPGSVAILRPQRLDCRVTFL